MNSRWKAAAKGRLGMSVEQGRWFERLEWPANYQFKFPALLRLVPATATPGQKTLLVRQYDQAMELADKMIRIKSWTFQDVDWARKVLAKVLLDAQALHGKMAELGLLPRGDEVFKYQALMKLRALEDDRQSGARPRPELDV